MSGSYLAARHASVERDASSAAAFYRSALRTDPKNNELLDRAFISSLADGDIDEAVKLADRILTLDKSNRVARLVVGVRDLKAKKYATAQININQSIRGPITDLVATLLSGWASYGAGDAKTAVANIDKLTGPEWYPLFKDLHAGMILELANKEKDAGARFERAYKLDDSMLRVSEAYARWLSRNKDSTAAAAIYETFDKKLPRHPLVQEGLRESKAGKKMSPLVETAQAGAAEALYGIGATLRMPRQLLVEGFVDRGGRRGVLVARQPARIGLGNPQHGIIELVGALKPVTGILFLVRKFQDHAGVQVLEDRIPFRVRSACRYWQSRSWHRRRRKLAQPDSSVATRSVIGPRIDWLMLICAVAYFFCLRSRTPTTSRATRLDLSRVRIRSASLTASSMSPSASEEMKARSSSSLFLGSVRSAER